MIVQLIPAKKFFQEIAQKPDQYVLIDVRNDWEYNDLEIVSERISLYEMPQKLSVFKKYEGKKIVLCCLTGERGNIGAKFLSSKGFNNIYNLQGGFEALMEAEESQT